MVYEQNKISPSKNIILEKKSKEHCLFLSCIHKITKIIIFKVRIKRNGKKILKGTAVLHSFLKIVIYELVIMKWKIRQHRFQLSSGVWSDWVYQKWQSGRQPSGIQGGIIYFLNKDDYVQLQQIVLILLEIRRICVRFRLLNPVQSFV